MLSHETMPARIDPFEEAAEAIAAMPPQPLSFTPGYAHGLDYSNFVDSINASMLASLGIPGAILTEGSANYSGSKVAFEMLEAREKESREQFRNWGISRMNAIFEEVARQCRTFVGSIYGVASRAYLNHHARLPGSERTSRLRKKRRTRVLRWYFDVYIRGVNR